MGFVDRWTWKDTCIILLLYVLYIPLKIFLFVAEMKDRYFGCRYNPHWCMNCRKNTKCKQAKEEWLERRIK